MLPAASRVYDMQTDRLTEWFFMLHFAAKNVDFKIFIIALNIDDEWKKGGGNFLNLRLNCFSPISFVLIYSWLRRLIFFVN